MSNETFWVNGEPFALLPSTNPLTPKTNTELYWVNGESCSDIVELAALPYVYPYTPPTPTISPYGAETYWVDGVPSNQIFPIDFIAPTFAGIGSLTLGSFGQLVAAWSTATDTSTPIKYEIYIQAGTATGLFNTSNIAITTSQLTASIFTLPNGSLITNATYYVGVRAVDLFGNRDSNVISQPYVVAGPTFAGISSLIVGSFGQLKTTWSAGSNPATNLEYEVYVQASTSTGLFNTSNISLTTTQLTADIFYLPNGSLVQPGLYYVGVRAKTGLGNRDSNAVSFSATSTGLSIAYDPRVEGSFAIDSQNRLVASFWATDSSVVLAPRLGTASYVIYDKNGSLVSGMSQSGIVADAQGFFKITPVASTLDHDSSFYVAKVSVTIDSVLVNFNIPVVYSEDGPQYEPRAVFSINASNQLQGTLWCVRDGVLLPNSLLGTASYTIYDKDGATIGIAESGISPDVNGYFKISPVSAAAILDLTHYVVKLTISAAGTSRVGTVGITLGE